MTYNLFLPGGIGGDAYKIWLLNKKYTTPKNKLLKAMLLERLAGVFAILVLLFVLFNFWSISIPYLNLFWLGIPFLYGLYYLIFCVYYKISNLLFHQVLGYSFVIQTVQAGCCLILASSMGLNRELEMSGIFFISSLATAVPLFLGGVGARESVFAYFANDAHMEVSTAIGAAILFSLITIVSSVPGLFYDWSLKNTVKKPSSV